MLALACFLTALVAGWRMSLLTGICFALFSLLGFYKDSMDAAVELAGGLGAVDELPQPRDRGLRVAVVAVVDPQPAAAAVLARLGHVGAQLVDDEADAAGGDPRDPLAGLRVRRVVVVGAQQRVDEEPRDVDVGRVDDGPGR